MDVKDGVAETPLSKRVGQPTRTDVRVVINAENNFVPQVKGYVNGLKKCERIWGIGTGDTRSGKASEVLGPDRIAPVGGKARPVRGEDCEGCPSFPLKAGRCPAPKICRILTMGDFL